MRTVLLVLTACLLAACVGNSARSVDIVRHDLGDPYDPGGLWPVAGIAVSHVEVRAAAWLDTPAQLYRLAYADPLTRYGYAENRWIAPPGDLLERWLQRRILSSPAAGSGCHLVIWLDELEQRFTTPQASQVVLAARTSLQSPRGAAVLAQQEFHVVGAAPTPDARGGVQATRAASAALTVELAKWLAKMARERPQVTTSCQEKP